MPIHTILQLNSRESPILFPIMRICTTVRYCSYRLKVKTFAFPLGCFCF